MSSVHIKITYPCGITDRWASGNKIVQEVLKKKTRKPGRGVAVPSLSRPMLIFYDSVQSLGALEFDEGTTYGYSKDVII
jgi:hypothetical protein